MGNSKMSKILLIGEKLTKKFSKTFFEYEIESMENTLKINVFEKSILFCQYLHNGSSDPYEILYGGQLLSCKLKF